ncbi:MAG: hypothetical protein RIE53_02415, partial [Rhodothermales bacterium]
PELTRVKVAPAPLAAVVARPARTTLGANVRVATLMFNRYNDFSMLSSEVNLGHVPRRFEAQNAGVQVFVPHAG